MYLDLHVAGLTESKLSVSQDVILFKSDCIRDQED